MTTALGILKPNLSTKSPEPTREINLPAPDSDDQRPATKACVSGSSGKPASLKGKKLTTSTESIFAKIFRIFFFTR